MQKYKYAIVYPERNSLIPYQPDFGVDAVLADTGKRIGICRHVSYQDAMETAWGISIDVRHESEVA